MVKLIEKGTVLRLTDKGVRIPLNIDGRMIHAWFPRSAIEVAKGINLGDSGIDRLIKISDDMYDMKIAEIVLEGKQC